MKKHYAAILFCMSSMVCAQGLLGTPIAYAKKIDQAVVQSNATPSVQKTLPPTQALNSSVSDSTEAGLPLADNAPPLQWGFIRDARIDKALEKHLAVEGIRLDWQKSQLLYLDEQNLAIAAQDVNEAIQKTLQTFGLAARFENARLTIID